LGNLQEDQLKKSLELTIDVRLQNILNEEIDRTIKEFNAKGAVGIIANPNNGEILAFISKPDFDPHYPNLAKSEELFNMASLGIYEMGSVFKALAMAVAFDTNCITMNDAYDTSYMKVGGFNLKDYHYMPGWHNQLKIEIPEKGTPLFPSDKRWSDLTTATISYGYGLSVSPLHFMQAVLPVYKLTMEVKMSFIPLHDRIAVEPIQQEEKTPGGIIIPDTAKEKPVRGKVVAVGKGIKSESGVIQPLDVEVGDIVLYGKWAGTEVKVEGQDLIIMKESDVMGKFN
ncbi:Co-chaperonin GroES, partial [Pseudolycoriella hygida]